MLRWKDFGLVPSFAIRESHYGESQEGPRFVGQNINRSARELDVALMLHQITGYAAGRIQPDGEGYIDYVGVRVGGAQPPSSTSSSPERYDDASLARKSAVPTISSADAMRRRLMVAAICSCTSGGVP